MPDKIDLLGNYIPFYGYTVICMMSNQNGLQQQWEDFLKNAPALSSYVSPLPASSYHVTLYDIFTQRHIPDRYLPASGLVPSPHWNNAYSKLCKDMNQGQTYCDNFKDGVKFMKTDFKIGRNPGNAVLIEGTLSNLEEVSVLDSNLRQVFGSIGKPVKRYHITLGYLFKEADDGDLKKMNDELTEIWDQVQNEVILDKPNVCYFETMKEFVPVKELFK